MAKWILYHVLVRIHSVYRGIICWLAIFPYQPRLIRKFFMRLLWAANTGWWRIDAIPLYLSAKIPERCFDWPTSISSTRAVTIKEPQGWLRKKIYRRAKAFDFCYEPFHCRVEVLCAAEPLCWLSMGKCERWARHLGPHRMSQLRWWDNSRIWIEWP